MKKLLAIGTIAMVLLVALATVAFARGGDLPPMKAAIKVIVNGRNIDSDVKPQLIGDRVLVPVRSVAEALGANVQWDEKLNTVKITSQQEASVNPKYYPRVPGKITTPEMALQAYFDALYYANNPNAARGAITGSIGMGKEPYHTAYGYWSKEWQAGNNFDKFLASWDGTANVELLKLLPAGEADGQRRFFVETKHLEAAGEKPRLGYFYYTGFFTVAETADGWRITGGSLEPENLSWKLGGHQPWRGVPEMVAQVELAGSIDKPLGKAIVENNTDGTVTVKFVDSNGKETHRAILVQLQDGIWRMLDKR